MKVIVHYKNGQQHTVNHLFICYTEWEGDGVSVQGELWPNTDTSAGTSLHLFVGVLFLEEISKEDGVVKYHFNPHTPMSIIPDVMTAKQRAKANRNGLMQMVNNTLSRLKDWKNYGQ